MRLGQPGVRRSYVDTENGRDLGHAVSLNFLQQEHIPVSWAELESSQQCTLERTRFLQARRYLAPVNRHFAGCHTVAGCPWVGHGSPKR